MKPPILPIVLFLTCLHLGTTQTDTPADTVTPEELAEFQVTQYPEKERFILLGLVTPEGTPFDRRGLDSKYVFLNLGATWCPYCAKEKATLEQFYQNNRDEGLYILSIYLGETPETVKEYLESNNYHFPAAVDTENYLRPLYAPRIPATYLLDQEGYIIAEIKGGQDWTGEKAQRILGYLLGKEEE